MRKKFPVYQLRSDPDKFADFAADNFDFLLGLAEPPTKRSKWTGFPGGVRVASKLELGDFAGFVGLNSIPVLSGKACDELRTFIEGAADLLTLGEFQGNEYCILRVSKVIDALDLDKSIVRRTPAGKPYGVSKFVFKPGAVEGHHLFKVPESRYEEPLISEEFRDAIKRAKLKGAYLRPVSS